MASALADAAIESILALSIKDGVESDKCVVEAYLTTIEQKLSMISHMESNTPEKVPIEWVVDIADEHGGWYFGTAYHYDDINHMIHIMIPDNKNPTFDGHVHLDYQTVHLIECNDGKTDALFNKLVRDSVTKVRWDLKWFEEDQEAPEAATPDDPPSGKWIQSVGKYYVRILNQLLVEDNDNGEKAFVMITADTNVRLQHCSKGKGQDDFNRLILNNQVQYTAAAMDEVQMIVTGKTTYVDDGALNTARDDYYGKGGRKGRNGNTGPPGGGDELGGALSKVWDYSKELKDAVQDLVEERERDREDNLKFATLFSAFSLDGDLEAGLSLYLKSEEIALKEDSRRLLNDSQEEEDTQTTQRVTKLVQKVERGVFRLVKSNSGDAAASQAASSQASQQELEMMKKREKKIKKDLDERERELSLLRSALPGQS